MRFASQELFLPTCQTKKESHRKGWVTCLRTWIWLDPRLSVLLHLFFLHYAFSMCETELQTQAPLGKQNQMAAMPCQAGAGAPVQPAAVLESEDMAAAVTPVHTCAV